MKHIIEILILLAVIVSVGALAGCSPESAAPGEPPGASPEVMQTRIDHERGLRAGAETLAAKEAARRTFWETLSVLGLLAVCAAFIIGTAIGSRGRKDATS